MLCSVCIVTLIIIKCCTVGTPSSLLPSIADLVSRYSTAEDVVTKSNDFSHVNGLGTISEAPKESDNLTYVHVA